MMKVFRRRGQPQRSAQRTSIRSDEKERRGGMNIEFIDEIEVVEVAGDQTVASFESSYC